MPIQTMFSAADGQAPWYPEFTVSVSAPARFKVWNRTPSGGNRPADVIPYASSNKAAPSQPTTVISVSTP